MNRAAETEFARLFGIKADWIDRVFTGIRRYGPFTEEGIAAVLLTKGLCKEEEALRVARNLVDGEYFSLPVRFIPLMHGNQKEYFATWNPYHIPSYAFS